VSAMTVAVLVHVAWRGIAVVRIVAHLLNYHHLLYSPPPLI